MVVVCGDWGGLLRGESPVFLGGVGLLRKSVYLCQNECSHYDTVDSYGRRFETIVGFETGNKDVAGSEGYYYTGNC